MIAVDTNVLVRVLLDQTDDPAQQARARAALLRAEAAGEPIFLSSLVVAETAWVLRGVARLSRAEIADLLEGLAQFQIIQFEDRVAVLDGLQALRNGGAGLADVLIRGAALRAGARVLLTFDQDLQRLVGCAAPT